MSSTSLSVMPMTNKESPWPEGVGIKAMEAYVPSQYMEQTDFEEYCGIPKGKYTVGLGQDKMGFISDREDVVSLAMTVVHRLMINHSIGMRSTYMEHQYDFYKPRMDSLYPEVDGPLSIACYGRALQHCYDDLCRKAKANGIVDTSLHQTTLDCFDALLFHSPYCKLVQKSVARLSFIDFQRNPQAHPELLRSIPCSATFEEKEVERAFLAHSQSVFESKAQPALLLAKNVGNMYTASVYLSLISFLISKPLEELVGSRIAVFSYGSGFCSSMYTIVVKKRGLEELLRSVRGIPDRLARRIKRTPQEFTDTIERGEKAYGKAPFKPSSSLDLLETGTWYLDSIDEKYRRTYELKKASVSNGILLMDILFQGCPSVAVSGFQTEPTEDEAAKRGAHRSHFPEDLKASNKLFYPEMLVKQEMVEGEDIEQAWRWQLYDSLLMKFFPLGDTSLMSTVQEVLELMSRSSLAEEEANPLLIRLGRILLDSCRKAILAATSSGEGKDFQWSLNSTSKSPSAVPKKKHNSVAVITNMIHGGSVKTVLNHHIRTTHGDGSVYPCSECSKTFKTKNYLYSHRKKVHGERTFCCE
ncbi:unnamed protein product, partial [Cyprideis torosa]